jgi:hypothetical protein
VSSGGSGKATGTVTWDGAAAIGTEKIRCVFVATEMKALSVVGTVDIHARFIVRVPLT